MIGDVLFYFYIKAVFMKPIANRLKKGGFCFNPFVGIV